MATAISWNGDRALEQSAGGLSVVTVPGRGGKIVSLRDADGIEWLAQPRLPQAPAARPGADFVSADMSGWDECAPSIVTCTMTDDTVLPDHGELWTEPWRVNSDTMSVHGESYGYEFSRTIFVIDERTLRFDYRVRTRGQPVPFLWAAHPQFLAPPGTRVVLDQAVDVVVDAVSPGHPIPIPWDPALAEIDSLRSGEARKFYLAPDARSSSIALVRPGGRMLTIRWDADLLPYLGVWMDAGMYSRERVIALEPTTGWYDTASLALARERLPILRADDTFDWSLDLTLS